MVKKITWFGLGERGAASGNPQPHTGEHQRGLLLGAGGEDAEGEGAVGGALRHLLQEHPDLVLRRRRAEPLRRGHGGPGGGVGGS